MNYTIDTTINNVFNDLKIKLNTWIAGDMFKSCSGYQNVLSENDYLLFIGPNRCTERF